MWFLACCCTDVVWAHLLCLNLTSRLEIGEKQLENPAREPWLPCPALQPSPEGCPWVPKEWQCCPADLPQGGRVLITSSDSCPLTLCGCWMKSFPLAEAAGTGPGLTGPAELTGSLIDALGSGGLQACPTPEQVHALPPRGASRAQCHCQGRPVPAASSRGAGGEGWEAWTTLWEFSWWGLPH